VKVAAADLADPADRERFERLYVESRVALLGYLVRRVAQPADAADLLGETFLTAWRRIADVPADDAARLWLFGVARYLVANHRRHQRAEQSLATSLQAALVVETSGSGERSDQPCGELILSALSTLRSQDREIVELSAWEQLSPSEIAVVLGMNPGAVRVRLHRIRNVLRETLLASGFPAPEHQDCA
jgi:RNA polymerase sigma-70 factor (ECF subfamily)